MSLWPSVRLSECCEIVGGATPSTSEPSHWGGDVHWATPKDLSELDGSYLDSTPRTLTGSGLASCSASVLPLRSVLFSSRAPIGLVAINRVPVATNQGFKSFVPDTSRVHAEYLLHWLRTHRPMLESLGNGATFKEVSKAVVSRVEMPLPPLAEQRRIAEVLDRAETLRAQRRQALAQLDSLAESIFFNMFGDVRSGPKFATGTIRPFVEASSGKSSKPVLAASTTAIPIYGGNGVNGWATTALYETPVLVFGRVGQQCGNAFMTEGPSWVTDNAIVVQIVDAEKLDATYLLHAFRMSDFSHRVRHLDLPFINQAMIVDTLIVIPPISAQQTFSACARSIEALRSVHRAALTELDALFASLQHRAFRGEL